MKTSFIHMTTKHFRMLSVIQFKLIDLFIIFLKSLWLKTHGTQTIARLSNGLDNQSFC